MPSLEASLRNLERARAAWSHPPRPWRSDRETRIIKRLVWQWFTYCGPRNWSARGLARWLGVSHTYIQKLVRQFRTDPGDMQRDARRHTPATFEHLRCAQEETRQQKERGWLRPPRRWRVAEFKIGDRAVRVVVPTKAEERRQAAKATGCVFGSAYVAPHKLPLWAKGMLYYSGENPCDPLIAVKFSIEASRGVRPVFSRRWRPGRFSC